MKTFLKPLLIIIVCLTAFLSCQTYLQERQKIELKNDLIELSKIKYGLFNVDEWKTILADIITKKIEEFNLDDTNREKMRIKIENLLTVAINDLELKYYEEKSKSFMGIIQTGVATITGTFGHIKKDIPAFTEQILDFLNDKDNRKAIRKYLTKKLNEYADSTFSETDYASVNDIIAKYQQGDLETTKTYLRSQVTEMKAAGEWNKYLLMAIAILSLCIIFLTKLFLRMELMLLLLLSSIFLFLGVLLPMIEIDARISQMNFQMLGEQISFTEQVLYYKSKSILDVVHLMIFQQRIDLMAVGILVLIFSMLFPISKLICSTLYLFKKETRNNAVVSFIVFKSGKWSMADVMVIAIFMAYIGFDGIISEQLRQLASMTESIDLLTTNKSNLLFGFYSFLAFVLLSLATSQKIQNEETIL